MSTTTFRNADLLGPILVSELPPLTRISVERPGLLARLREDLVLRRRARAFDRALGLAGPGEQGDLLALSRRD